MQAYHHQNWLGWDWKENNNLASCGIAKGLCKAVFFRECEYRSFSWDRSFVSFVVTLFVSPFFEHQWQSSLFWKYRNSYLLLQLCLWLEGSPQTITIETCQFQRLPMEFFKFQTYFSAILCNKDVSPDYEISNGKILFFYTMQRTCQLTFYKKWRFPQMFFLASPGYANVNFDTSW